jgi:hypothetical protein
MIFHPSGLSGYLVMFALSTTAATNEGKDNEMLQMLPPSFGPFNMRSVIIPSTRIISYDVLDPLISMKRC